MIPYSCVKKKIGPDAVLVEIKEKVFAKILDIVYNEGGNKFVSQTD